MQASTSLHVEVLNSVQRILSYSDVPQDIGIRSSACQEGLGLGLVARSLGVQGLGLRDPGWADTFKLRASEPVQGNLEAWQGPTP